MKRIQILNYFAVLLFLLSCSGSSDEMQSENQSALSKKSKTLSKSTSEELPIVYAVVFPYENCVNGSRYKYYATATDVVPYDRHVYSIAKRGDATIILPVRIIPANQNVSPAIGIFVNDQTKVGDISIQAQHVFKNNIATDVSSEFDRPFLDFNINNCVSEDYSSNCNSDVNNNSIPDCLE
ncbi:MULTISPECIES: hypothetical protein [unclassified Chryseobacterium]|uniref:hypothetical protein n=1 Tax=unclassified Chryseobacterium TaxID=2593645 RepID=UPI002269DC0A|nr:MULTISPECIES: hypothetical protein [unclassified Chryseobacterium]